MKFWIFCASLLVLTVNLGEAGINGGSLGIIIASKSSPYSSSSSDNNWYGSPRSSTTDAYSRLEKNNTQKVSRPTRPTRPAGYAYPGAGNRLGSEVQNNANSSQDVPKVAAIRISSTKLAPVDYENHERELSFMAKVHLFFLRLTSDIKISEYEKD